MSPTWLAVPIGLVVLLLGVTDSFLTVLPVQMDSPATGRIARILWRALLRADRTLGERRGALLVWSVPALVIGVVGFWASSLIAGFALVYLPMMDAPGFFSRSGTNAIEPLLDAVYFSGVTFLTIGYGDIVPAHPVTRILAMAEGASGLLTISMAVTYLLAVYPVLTRTLVLAAVLNQEMGGRADGLALVDRYLLAGRGSALDDRLRWIDEQLLHLVQGHSFFPVLYYARPARAHESFARVLVLVQGIVATLRYAVDADRFERVASDPALLTLEEGLYRTLNALAQSMHVDPAATTGDDTGLREEFRALARALADRGQSLAPAALADREDQYVAFRRTTDRYIEGYAANLGYTPVALRGTLGREARGAGRHPEQTPRVGLL